MKALVTGGGGFLGKALITRLLEQGHVIVSLSRADYPELRALGAETRQGDIADAQTVIDAARDCEAVFHVAAKAGYWGPYTAYYSANVIGTENVIMACRECRVPRLIYTSTPSVAYGSNGDIEGADESLPTPARFDAPYPATKALAEERVRQANDATLQTVALRPHLIWGPGDTNLVARLLSRARAGTLLRIGDGRNMIDTTYIDNAVHAHVLACQVLTQGSPAAGNAYFISDGSPVYAWEMINRILEAADLPPVRRAIPAWLAYGLGGLAEGIYALLGRAEEPRMTRFLARNLSTSHWFDISAARRDLGYEPVVTIEQGLAALRAWLAGRDATVPG